MTKYTVTINPTVFEHYKKLSDDEAINYVIESLDKKFYKSLIKVEREEVNPAKQERQIRKFAKA